MSISREMGYVAVEMFGLKLELRRSAGFEGKCLAPLAMQ